MNADHPRFAEWDAAYVLGALSAADRHDFETHLDACPHCRAAVAELAPTAGLLSRLSAQDAARIDEGTPDASARAGFVSLAHERARRRRRGWWAAAAAAAVLVVAAIAVPVTIAVTSRPGASFALEALVDIPIEASVRLTSVTWGTRIDLECRYPDVYGSDAPDDGWVYVLAVVGADGADESVSTWRAGPGTSARLSAGTALAVDDIRSVEIRSTSGSVLMRYDLAPG